ncbi:hypothetical protein Tco_0393012 [Tanacetum coccineum]
MASSESSDITKSSKDASAKLTRAELNKRSGDADLSKAKSGAESPPEFWRSFHVEGHIRSGVISSVLAQRHLRNNPKKGDEGPSSGGTKLSSTFITAEVLEKVGSVAYKLELPQELSRVHNTFHVSNLKKCYSDEPLAVPLEGLHVDDKLRFVEEPVEIMDREVKRLKQSRIPIVKVRWNSRRGPEFTWEREDQFQKKYPHLFTKPVPSSSVAT